MKKIIVTSILFTTIPFFTIGQCITNVDFNTWLQGGIPANGNWTVQSGGSQIFQSVNGWSTFFLTPFDLINVEIEGSISVNDTDDDFIGFVFGLQSPLSATTYDNYDMYLLDWKKKQQSETAWCPGSIGQEGFSLSRVNGIIPSSSCIGAQHFWGHNGTNLSVLASDWGVGKGWTNGVTHNVKLVYTYSEIKIFIDENLIFQETGCFQPGRFGFYNFSQPNVTYSNFTYSLKSNFEAENDICLGDTLNCQFVCDNSFSFATIDTLKWIFGDGTQIINGNINSSNVNPSHIYSSGGNYDITLISIDINGCSDTIVKNVIVRETPSINIGNDTSICLGDSLFYDVTHINATNYSWQDGSIYPNYTISQEGIYFVTATNNCGTGSDTINISKIEIPVVNLGNDTLLCVGNSIVYDVTHIDATNYLWQDGSINPNYTISQEGTYFVILSNICGTRSDTINISKAEISFKR